MTKERGPPMLFYNINTREKLIKIFINTKLMPLPNDHPSSVAECSSDCLFFTMCCASSLG